jgi:hypothetical protein
VIETPEDVPRRRTLEKGHDFALPHFVQRVGPRPPAPLRGQHRTPFDTPRAAHADTGLGRSRLLVYVRLVTACT